MKAFFLSLLLLLLTQMVSASDKMDEKLNDFIFFENQTVADDSPVEEIKAVPLEPFTAHEPVEVQQPTPAPHQEPSCCAEIGNCLCCCFQCLASLDAPHRRYNRNYGYSRNQTIFGPSREQRDARAMSDLIRCCCAVGECCIRDVIPSCCAFIRDAQEPLCGLVAFILRLLR